MAQPRRSFEDMSEVQVRPLRRAEDDVLGEHDVFGPDERIQLLDGELVAISSQKASHAGIVEALTERGRSGRRATRRAARRLRVIVSLSDPRSA